MAISYKFRQYHPPSWFTWQGQALKQLTFRLEGPWGSHLTYLDERSTDKYVDKPTIVVFVDGACSGNGLPDAKASIGVHFGAESEYNYSGTFSGIQTNQRAVIQAAIQALNIIRNGMLPNTALNITAVILASDSKYVYASMTEWMSKWKRNGWVNAKGYQVKNIADLKELDQIIEELFGRGVEVRIWNIPREYNVEADSLAKGQLQLV